MWKNEIETNTSLLKRLTLFLKVDTPPSYIDLLKRLQVIRTMIILFFGLGGGIGKSNYSATNAKQILNHSLFPLEMLIFDLDILISDYQYYYTILIGRLTKDQEVTDIWLVSELLNAYINVFFVKFET